MVLSTGADPRVAELRRQVDRLVERAYPELAGLSHSDFRERLEPLEEVVGRLGPAGPGRIPFVVVVRSELVPAVRAIEWVERDGQGGVSAMDDDDLAEFAPIESVGLPDGDAYLIADVDTGAATRDVTPDAALGMLESEGRSPLTVDEGIALVTHHPEVVSRNAGFSLLGSRCGDRRVTAIWVSRGRPKLRWCWAGNPHTWLGSASCAARVGSTSAVPSFDRPSARKGPFPRADGGDERPVAAV